MSEATIAKKAQQVTEVAEQFKNAASVVVVDVKQEYNLQLSKTAF